MPNTFSQLSDDVAAAIERAAPSVVQVYGHHRPSAGIVVAPELIAAPARALRDDTVSVRLASGDTIEGSVVGHGLTAGIAVVRAAGLTAPALAMAPEPRVGHLAIALGRTWSGGVMASVTNVAVVGGPLRTGRVSQLDRVIRIAQPPHGAFTGGALIDGEGRALGAITGAAIRDTTIVIPAGIAWPLAEQLAQAGGTRQGFIGIGSSAVTLPRQQRGGRRQEHGLLVHAVVPESPADAASILVGDIIVAFDGRPVEEPEALVTLLRGDRAGKAVPLTVIRGVQEHEIAVTIGERPRRERRRAER